jgi:hypothetical protein
MIFVVDIITQLSMTGVFSAHYFLQSAQANKCVYRSSAKDRTTPIVSPANISVLNDVFAWFMVPLIASGRF